MALANDDDVIKTFPSDRADQPCQGDTAKPLGLSSRPAASRLGSRDGAWIGGTSRLVRTRRSGALQGGIRGQVSVAAVVSG
jgi:hypothetical protein